MDLFGEDNPQIFALCGRGPRSSLRILRHGLQVSELAAQELPGNPNAIWSVRTSSSGMYSCRSGEEGGAFVSVERGKQRCSEEWCDDTYPEGTETVSYQRLVIS